MFDVHFGLSPADFEGRYRTLLPHTDRFGTDDDGWNAWGEAPGTDANDADTIHVIAQFPTLGTAIDAAIKIAQDNEDLGDDVLVPSTGPTFPDTLVVVTPTDDWSEDLLIITPQGIRTVAGVVTYGI